MPFPVVCGIPEIVTPRDATRRKRRRVAVVIGTVLGVLIAVTLLSALSIGMMLALRIGISALWRTDQRLMDNRRIAGAQRILEQELQGLIPAMAACSGGGAGDSAPKVSMFSGQNGQERHCAGRAG